MWRLMLLLSGKKAEPPAAEEAEAPPPTQKHRNWEGRNQVRPPPLPQETTIWLKSRRVPFVSVGIMPGRKRISEGRILWCWCSKVPGSFI